MDALDQFLNGFFFGENVDPTNPTDATPTDPNVPPAPADPVTPTPAPAPTVGDLITAVVADKAAVAGDTDALNAATLKLSTDQARLKADSDALAGEINTRGGAGSVDPVTGVITAYEPDGAGGVKVTTLRPVSAPAAQS